MPRPLSCLGASETAPDSLRDRFVLTLHSMAQESNIAAFAPIDDGIHRLRLVIKRLRALLRLMPQQRRADPVGSWDLRLRQISQRLAPSRDRCVRRRLLRKVVRPNSREDDWMNRMGSSLDPLSSTRLVLREMALKLAGIIFSLISRHRGHPDPDFCRKALRRSWRRVQRYRRAASRTGATEDFHGWRRWQKRMESQCHFMGMSDPRRGALALRELHLLQEEIGHLHDADQLLEWLCDQTQSRRASQQPPDSLVRRVKRLRSRLRRRVICDARRVFKGRWRAFLKHGPARGLLRS